MRRSGPPTRRTPLRKGAPPARSAPLRRSADPARGVGAGKGSAPRRTLRARPVEPGEREWKRRRTGHCSACGERGPIVWHHAVAEQVIRRAGGWCWDPRWAIPVGAPLAFGGRCGCHDAHHHPGVNDTRFPYSLVRAATRQLAHAVLGSGPASTYFYRHYRGAPEP